MNRNTSLLVLLCLVMPWLAATSGFADDARTVSQAGVFSYQAPEGWEVKKTQVSPYPVALAAVDNNFRANINLQTEDAAISLNEYVTAAVERLKSTPPIANFKVVEQKPFQTASGIAGVRLVATDEVGTYSLQQVFYFFAAKGATKLVVTCTSRATDGAKFAPTFEAALKTFTMP